ncbi:MAG: lipoprotein [Rhodocyclales bacterium]|nr:lipoprotein [Rhodocyclales bacterium]
MQMISRILGPTALTALLAACAGTPTADVETRGTRPASAPVPAARNVERPGEARTTPPEPVVLPFPSSTSRKGGYYKDDGPGDNPPPDMASIPDAQPRPEPLHRFANRPYVALGQNYVPRQALTPYKESGIASWYGRRFHGVRTSSGERYDMYGMTAAHPTLPIPSYARVTNRENGKSVVVRINDRGPFHADRVIDLSYTAAWKLGYVSKGSTRVDVEAIVPEGVTLLAKNVPPMVAPVSLTATPPLDPEVLQALPELQQAEPQRTELQQKIPAAPSVASRATEHAEPSASDPPAGVYLQLGSFSTSLNAQGFRDYARQELASLKQQLFIITEREREGERERERFRLQLGPFTTTSAARDAAARVEGKLKLKPFLVQR